MSEETTPTLENVIDRCYTKYTTTQLYQSPLLCQILKLPLGLYATIVPLQYQILLISQMRLLYILYYILVWSVCGDGWLNLGCMDLRMPHSRCAATDHTHSTIRYNFTTRITTTFSVKTAVLLLKCIVGNPSDRRVRIVFTLRISPEIGRLFQDSPFKIREV